MPLSPSPRALVSSPTDIFLVVVEVLAIESFITGDIRAEIRQTSAGLDFESYAHAIYDEADPSIKVFIVLYFAFHTLDHPDVLPSTPPPFSHKTSPIAIDPERCCAGVENLAVIANFCERHYPIKPGVLEEGTANDIFFFIFFTLAWLSCARRLQDAGAVHTAAGLAVYGGASIPGLAAALHLSYLCASPRPPFMLLLLFPARF